MKAKLTAILATVVLLGVGSAAADTQINEQAGRVGYSLGHQIGEDLIRQGREIDQKTMLTGLRDGLDGTEPSIPLDEMKVVLLALKRGIESASGDDTGRGDGLEVKDRDASLAAEPRRLGYSIGYQVGGDFRRQGLAVDVDMVLRGVRDAIAASEPLMTTAEMRQTLTDLKLRAAKAKALRSLEQAQINLEAGTAFLAENAQREGVVTLASGLQYRVLAAGEGDAPGATDTVTVHYRGRLIDGTEFDSSYGRGEPDAFPLNHAIPGWIQGLQLMREGAKYELYLPSDLAYDKGELAGQVLIFEVELLEVKPANTEP